MKITKELARRIAARVPSTKIPLQRADVRDIADIETAGDCDAFQLEMLTDWIAEIVGPLAE